MCDVMERFVLLIITITISRAVGLKAIGDRIIQCWTIVNFEVLDPKPTERGLILLKTRKQITANKGVQQGGHDALA